MTPYSTQNMDGPYSIWKMNDQVSLWTMDDPQSMMDEWNGIQEKNLELEQRLEALRESEEEAETRLQEVTKQLSKAEKEAELTRRRNAKLEQDSTKPKSAVAFLTTHHPKPKVGSALKPTVSKKKSAIKHMAEEAKVRALLIVMVMPVILAQQHVLFASPCTCHPYFNAPSPLTLPAAAAQGERGEAQRVWQGSHRAVPSQGRSSC